jgi:hypothetical protein
MGSIELGSINGLDEDSFMYECMKLGANPLRFNVYDHPKMIKPSIGNHITIINWSMQDNVCECVRLSHLPYLVVKEVIPDIIWINDRYYWSYIISIVGSSVKFLQWHYEIIY